MPKKKAKKTTTNVSKDKILDQLIQNNLILQSKIIDLVKSNESLTSEMKTMVSFFREAGEQMTLESENERLKPFIGKIGELLEQNKAILRGLILVQKYIKTSGAASELTPRSSLRSSFDDSSF
jgi:dynactin complex subunit